MRARLMTGFLTGICLVAMISSVGATTLTSRVSIDNGYVAYLSTDASIQGTQFAAHNDWYTVYTDTIFLDAGIDYFLHIYAYDQGGIAGFIGEFFLDGSGHVFQNDSDKLLTNITDWSGNNEGWGSAMTTLTDLGANGVSPWGSRTGSIDSSARWVWAGDAYNNDVAYFSTKISAVNVVPEPSSALLLAGGLAGLALYLRNRKES